MRVKTVSFIVVGISLFLLIIPMSYAQPVPSELISKLDLSPEKVVMLQDIFQRGNSKANEVLTQYTVSGASDMAGLNAALGEVRADMLLEIETTLSGQELAKFKQYTGQVGDEQLPAVAMTEKDMETAVASHFVADSSDPLVPAEMIEKFNLSVEKVSALEEVGKRMHIKATEILKQYSSSGTLDAVGLNAALGEVVNAMRSEFATILSEEEMAWFEEYGKEQEMRD